MATATGPRSVDIPSAELLNDKLFKFIIGPAKKEYMVHADVFARLSAPLDALINGNFSEARDKVAIWDDVDEATFNRLRQFAYCGDYDCATPERIVENLPNIICIEEGDENAQERRELHDQIFDSYNNFTTHTLPKKRHGYWWKLPYCIGHMHDDLHDNQTVIVTRKRKYGDSHSAYAHVHDGKTKAAGAFVLWIETLQDRFDKSESLIYDDPKGEPFTNLKDLLFCHANLHTLADKYCIAKLAGITTVKLGNILWGHTIFKDSIKSIAELIGYVFENTVAKDQIRDLLMAFGAVIAEDVYDKKKEVWTQMLLDNPDFTVGVMNNIISLRLCESHEANM